MLLTVMKKRLTRTQTAISFIILTTLLGVIAIPVSGLFCDPRDKLTERPSGANHHFYQEREPTEEERQAGEHAFRGWKSAHRFFKPRLAAEIILGKTLIGLTQKQIVDVMGEPNASYTLHDENPQIRHTGYDCMGLSVDQYDLLIDLDDTGKVYRAYLNINY